MWTSGGSVCTTDMSRSAVDRLRRGSRMPRSSACGQAAYTPSCCCTHAVFKQAPVDRLLARRGSNQRRYDTHADT